MELTIYTREYNMLDTIQNFMDFYYIYLVKNLKNPFLSSEYICL